MSTSTVSAKYQIVIPKELRKKLQIKPGQRVFLETNRAGDIVVSSDSQVEKSLGILKGAWGKNSDDYAQNMREEWRDRTR